MWNCTAHVYTQNTLVVLHISSGYIDNLTEFDSIIPKLQNSMDKYTMKLHILLCYRDLPSPTGPIDIVKH